MSAENEKSFEDHLDDARKSQDKPAVDNSEDIILPTQRKVDFGVIANYGCFLNLNMI